MCFLMKSYENSPTLSKKQTIMEFAMNNIIQDIYAVHIDRYRLFSYLSLTCGMILFVFSKHTETENINLLFHLILLAVKK